MKLIIAASIESIATRLDGTIKFTVGTQEMASEDAARLFEFRSKFVKVLITDTNIQPLEEKLIEETTIVDGKKVKSKSQRLRAVMYRMHEGLGGTKDTFDQFYNTEMEKLIDEFKAKLD